MTIFICKTWSRFKINNIIISIFSQIRHRLKFNIAFLRNFSKCIPSKWFQSGRNGNQIKRRRFHERKGSVRQLRSQPFRKMQGLPVSFKIKNQFPDRKSRSTSWKPRASSSQVIIFSFKPARRYTYALQSRATPPPPTTSFPKNSSLLHTLGKLIFDTIKPLVKWSFIRLGKVTRGKYNLEAYGTRWYPSKSTVCKVS